MSTLSPKYKLLEAQIARKDRLLTAEMNQRQKKVEEEKLTKRQLEDTEIQLEKRNTEYRTLEEELNSTKQDLVITRKKSETLETRLAQARKDFQQGLEKLELSRNRIAGLILTNRWHTIHPMDIEEYKLPENILQINAEQKTHLEIYESRLAKAREKLEDVRTTMLDYAIQLNTGKKGSLRGAVAVISSKTPIYVSPAFTKVTKKTNINSLLDKVPEESSYSITSETLNQDLTLLYAEIVHEDKIKRTKKVIKKHTESSVSWIKEAYAKIQRDTAIPELNLAIV